MSVNIDNLTIGLPVPRSATNPVALEIPGSQALQQYPELVTRQPDGSVQFTAPTLGASSKGTQRTRCEWKEAKYWLLESAREHSNRQEMTLTRVNSAQKVVISQMHVLNDDSPVVKVFWNKGKITLGFRQHFDQPDPVNSTVLDKVPLGARFSILIHATASAVITVQASCNGRTSNLAPMTLDPDWAGHAFDFHGGVYNQVDYTSATLATDGSVCIIHDLQLSHV
ncbi:polysaccharide lyase family 7 protein [Pseudomonas citronellolis]|uniref:polysaccharide lyase family 7 protein n=1 Tax=Pseudomonas citronellolis TaxID=53408 RepID=UPI000778EE91|nr:polysaccharide lyase family 7 protein [Pseudomonas citronellolis]AMO74789.1 Alginate lyase [Pseudomonas citronellolis]